MAYWLDANVFIAAKNFAMERHWLRREEHDSVRNAKGGTASVRVERLTQVSGKGAERASALEALNGSWQSGSERTLAAPVTEVEVFRCQTKTPSRGPNERPRRKTAYPYPVARRVPMGYG